MAESTESLTQRVEALEQISHARVVERIGQIEQRVSRIESAREAEESHVATKADIARLETSFDWEWLLLKAWLVTIGIAMTAVISAAAAFSVAKLS